MSLLEQDSKSVAGEVQWIQAYSSTCCEVVKTTASEAPADNSADIGVRVMALFLQLPILMPWSDAFFRYLALIEPKVEVMFEKFENANEDNKLVCADIKVALNSVIKARPRTQYDALARLSYL